MTSTVIFRAGIKPKTFTTLSGTVSAPAASLQTCLTHTSAQASSLLLSLIKNGKIAEIGENLDGEKIIDATGLTVGDGDAAVDRGYFYGREILMTVPTIVKDFDTANARDTVGYFFQPDNFVINENFGFTVDRYYNYERRKWITVATVVVDGKPLNNTGFIKLVKG